MHVHLLLLLVECHVVEGLLKPLNVDLKAVQHLGSRHTSDVLLDHDLLDPLLLEKVYQGWFGHLRVIVQPVVFNPALHIFRVVVGTEGLLL